MIYVDTYGNYISIRMNYIHYIHIHIYRVDVYKINNACTQMHVDAYKRIMMHIFCISFEREKHLGC